MDESPAPRVTGQSGTRPAVAQATPGSTRRRTSRYRYFAAKRRRRRRRIAGLLVCAALVVAVAASTSVLHQSEASAAIIPVPPTVHTTTTAWEPLPDTAATTAASATSDSVVASTVVSAPSSTTTTIYTHPVADPARVVIPVLGVDALLIHAGLRENGSVELPPYGLAAWYKLGPAPGANGPAVIFAHNDSKKGRDIFYHLGRLQKGDIVQVYGDDGREATFAIDRVEMALKTEFPIQRVWDGTDDPVIRLVTCGGEFDRDSGHYLSNIIAYGHLVE